MLPNWHPIGHYRLSALLAQHCSVTVVSQYCWQVYIVEDTSSEGHISRHHVQTLQVSWLPAFIKDTANAIVFKVV